MIATEQPVQEKELEQLISLAEDISNKIDELKNSIDDRGDTTSKRIKKLMPVAIIVTGFITMSYLVFEIGFNNSQLLRPIFYPFLVAIIIGIVLVLLINSTFQNEISQPESVKKIKTKIVQEQKILGELLNMIHSHKELAYQDMSVVSRAVFEMRLNRIHFSAGNGF